MPANVLSKKASSVCAATQTNTDGVSTRSIENCIQSKKDPQIIAQCRADDR